MKNEPAAFLSVVWPNGDVFVDIAVSQRNWSRIVRGQAVTIRGKGDWYEGRFFWDYWDFSDGLDGTLIVRYGSPKDGDYSGQGFIGTPREAQMEEKSERLELDQWEAAHFADTVRAWKENLERAIDGSLTDDDVYQIARTAQNYNLLQGAAKYAKERRKLLERVAKSADLLLQVSAESDAKHVRPWSSRQEYVRLRKTLMGMRHQARWHAQTLAKGARPNRPRNEALRNLMEAVDRAYHNAGGKGSGVYWDRTDGREAGAVLDCTMTALEMAGVKYFPSPSSIRAVAGEIEKAKT